MAKKLIKEIVCASGLPEDFATKKLEGLLYAAGYDPSTAGLEQIRDVLSNLLQDLILDMDVTKN